MNQIKHLFPIFETNPGLVYLDSGATTLKPNEVLKKMMEYYGEYSANIHRGVYKLSERATGEYELTRNKTAEFLNGEEREIIFTSGTTASLNLAARIIEGRQLERGGEIVVTEMEHHSNLVPWQELAKRKGLKLKFIEVAKCRLKTESLKKLIGPKTKVLALTHVSNVLGTINPIKDIVKKAKSLNPEILVVVDGAQAVAHMKVDVKELGADFYAFSGHKMYGPTGVGVLWVREDILKNAKPVEFGGGMIAEVKKESSTWAPFPYCFEAGTPPVGEVVGLGAAIDFILGIGWSRIIEQENRTKYYALEKLSAIEGIRLHASGEAGVLAFEMEKVHAHDIATILDTESVCVRAGHHCTMPLHELLGAQATTRVSLGIYNDEEDIDSLVKGINKVKAIFKI